MMLSVFLWVSVFFWALLFHELGHFVILRYRNPSAEIRFYYDDWKHYGFKVGKYRDYIIMDRPRRLLVYMVGIAAGLIPLLFAIAYDENFVFLAGLYLIGCIPDIKQLYIMLNDTKIGL